MAKKPQQPAARKVDIPTPKRARAPKETTARDPAALLDVIAEKAKAAGVKLAKGASEEAIATAEKALGQTQQPRARSRAGETRQARADLIVLA